MVVTSPASIGARNPLLSETERAPLEPILGRSRSWPSRYPDATLATRVGRDNERNANREADDEDEAEAESASTTSRARGRQAPVNKLNMYMRAVAVVALLIIGGVGVYKGRNMLASKETGPKIAKVKDPTKFEPVDPKPAEAKPATPRPESHQSRGHLHPTPTKTKACRQEQRSQEVQSLAGRSQQREGEG